ncbi:glycosyltransferase [Pontibacter sp. 172403-2]|uniref:glycosyltransferase family 2 protein n=1 Tax=Pontibacter rufus TaxID=2791028 RepID=UPI0018AFA60E|nr:glycosyltransferase family A protein [Pontibacter sp. 172403-2]MBF9253838.1 glycosyltransferase [Pontibacter sp. 172403-2]
MTDILLVSIIIPCYNVQAYIEECLASVYEQVYASIEVICIDNNSTDNTYDILLALKEKYPRLIVTSESKKGANAARNKGLSLAKGEWIQFLDADDLLKPNKISHQLSLIQTDSSLVFIAGSSIKQSVRGIQTQNIVKCKDKWIALASNGLGNTCANFFRKDALLQINGWNEDLLSSQETDLMFRLLQHGAIVYFDSKPLTIIRVRDSGSISQDTPVDNIIRYAEIRGNILKYLKISGTDLDVIEDVSQIVFDKIRELYKYNSAESIRLFEAFLSSNFVPGVSAATTSSYITAYKWLGFKKVQKLRSILSKLKK